MNGIIKRSTIVAFLSFGAIPIACVASNSFPASNAQALDLDAGQDADLGTLNPEIVAPGETYPGNGGLTYGEWQAEYWTWAFQTPFDAHPWTQNGNVDCSAGERNVIFLSGSFANGPYVRNCTASEGKAFLIPLDMDECSTALGDNKVNPSGDAGALTSLPADPTVLAQCAETLSPTYVRELTIDGQSVFDLTPPSEAYRADSAMFSFTTPAAPARNIFFWGWGCGPGNGTTTGCPSGNAGETADPGKEYSSVSSSIMVIVKPLAKGAHTIHWTTIWTPAGTPADQVDQNDITYNLTVR